MSRLPGYQYYDTRAIDASAAFAVASALVDAVLARNDLQRELFLQHEPLRKVLQAFVVKNYPDLNTLFQPGAVLVQDLKLLVILKYANGKAGENYDANQVYIDFHYQKYEHCIRGLLAHFAQHLQTLVGSGYPLQSLANKLQLNLTRVHVQLKTTTNDGNPCAPFVDEVPRPFKPAAASTTPLDIEVHQVGRSFMPVIHESSVKEFARTELADYASISVMGDGNCAFLASSVTLLNLVLAKEVEHHDALRQFFAYYARWFYPEEAQFDSEKTQAKPLSNLVSEFCQHYFKGNYRAMMPSMAFALRQYAADAEFMDESSIRQGIFLRDNVAGSTQYTHPQILRKPGIWADSQALTALFKKLQVKARIFDFSAGVCRRHLTYNVADANNKNWPTVYMLRGGSDYSGHYTAFAYKTQEAHFNKPKVSSDNAEYYYLLGQRTWREGLAYCIGPQRQDNINLRYDTRGDITFFPTWSQFKYYEQARAYLAKSAALGNNNALVELVALASALIEEAKLSANKTYRASCLDTAEKALLKPLSAGLNEALLLQGKVQYLKHLGANLWQLFKKAWTSPMKWAVGVAFVAAAVFTFLGEEALRDSGLATVLHMTHFGGDLFILAAALLIVYVGVAMYSTYREAADVKVNVDKIMAEESSTPRPALADNATPTLEQLSSATLPSSDHFHFSKVYSPLSTVTAAVKETKSTESSAETTAAVS